MKREVYEAIGGLDEEFGLGLFDDDDLDLRARKAGFELAVARDLFIHQFGGRTFAGKRVDTVRLLAENEQRFADKWGNLAPQGERVFLRHWGAPALNFPEFRQPQGADDSAGKSGETRGAGAWRAKRDESRCTIDQDTPRARVHVIPLGVDPELFRPGLEPLALPSGPQIRFQFVGGTIFRKGDDLLLTAFARESRPADGIGLVIKEMGSKSFYRGQTAEDEVSALRERGYAVEYIDRDLSDTEMAGLYSACDCLVHPFRGEGFGLPVVEAMACGLPVIVTGAGPALDYATDETAYLIPAQRGRFAECRVGDIKTIGRPWLFEPDVDVLVDLLKRVAGDLAAAKAKGMTASAHIREHFTWVKTADAVERRLSALAGLGATRPFHDEVRLVGPARGGQGRPPRCTALLSPVERATVPAVRPGTTGGGQGRPPHCNALLSSSSVERASVPAFRPKVSLTMIVRDEQENLRHCLD